MKAVFYKFTMYIVYSVVPLLKSSAFVHYYLETNYEFAFVVPKDFKEI